MLHKITLHTIISIKVPTNIRCVLVRQFLFIKALYTVAIKAFIYSL